MGKRLPAGTPQEIQRAVNLANLGKNAREIGEIMGRPRQTVAQWLTKARAEGLQPNMVAAEDAAERERIGYQDRIRELEAQLRAIHRDNLTAEIVRKHIIGLSEQPPDPPKWILGRKVSKGRTPDVPCANLSDLHWGEVVDPAQVNGINEYNIEVAQRRLKRWAEKLVYLYERHTVHKDAPGLVLNLGGDMVSGDIHDELTETNELPTMPVLLDLYGCLIWVIENLADVFGRIFIPCEPGNHGRNTHKPRLKNRAYSNFDWLLYCLLEKHFQRDGRVQFYIPSGADALYTVNGHRHLLTHGDNLGVSGGDGIIGALGPILRGDFKVRHSNAAMGQPYDTLVIGHWHQYLPLDRVIVNGSLKGYDEFAKLKLRAAPEPPRQALWFVSSEYGIIDHRPIYVEKPKKESASVWVSWPKEAA